MRRRALHMAALKRVTHREYPLVPGEGLCHGNRCTVRNSDHIILQHLIETFLENEWNEIRSPNIFIEGGVNNKFNYMNEWHKMKRADSRTHSFGTYQPWIGCGAKAGWVPTGLPSVFLSVLMPDPIRAAAPGSAKMIFVLGLFSLIYLPAP